MNHKYWRTKTKKKKTYRLWTFQSVSAINKLRSKGILEASWDGYSSRNTFINSYQWMANQLGMRNMTCKHFPPIWAWHSCNTYENAPTLVDARCLLSDIQLEDGIQTIEFECPADLALLSSYGIWNKLLYDVFPLKDQAKINRRMMKILFNVN